MAVIKIFISYHDEHPLIRSEILTPIQTGCADAPKLFEGMLRDDGGDNISHLNNKYCELTAQYWVWKNYDKIGNSDMVGFMHYRRHFMFDDWMGNPDWCWLPKGNVYFVPNITPEYMKHITDEKIKRKLINCDCLVLKPYNLRNLQSDNCRIQYSKLLKQDVKNFDILIKTIKELYPDYSAEANRLCNDSMQYLCNMFVMKKDLFFEYSDFCFKVLQQVDKQIDSSNMDDKASRFLGYFGEFLLTMFLFKIQKRKNIRIKKVNGSFILNDNNIDTSLSNMYKYYLKYKFSFGKKRRSFKQKYKKIKNLRKFMTYQ